VIDAWKRFNARTRHLQSQHSVGVGVGLGLVYGLLFGLLLRSVPAGVAYGVLSAVMQIFLWRPGGMSRRRYERWCAQIEQAPFPAPAAWYADPTGRYRMRYWNGAAWTEHVCNDAEQSIDILPAAPTASG
jgi:hypothetical protein